METKRSELIGAKRILRQCLGLEDGQSLVIILDETTAKTAAVLVQAADTRGHLLQCVFGACRRTTAHPSA